MSTSDVIRVCQQLTSEGKQPSVALIKPRLAKPLPLPTIITGLKSFNANPKQKVAESPVSDDNTTSQASLEQRVSQLEAEVQLLKTVIEQLQASSAE